VLAHSHGNKILVRSLCSDKRAFAAANRLTRLILVEPDVDQKFLEERAASLGEISEQIVIYHTVDDRGLALAGFLFNSIRAGQRGLTSKTDGTGPMNRVEVIDASRVARGLSRHSPHLESPEVISDIYHLLRGMKPNERFHLRQVDGRSGHWEMVPIEF